MSNSKSKDRDLLVSDVFSLLKTFFPSLETTLDVSTGEVKRHCENPSCDCENCENCDCCECGDTCGCCSRGNCQDCDTKCSCDERSHRSVADALMDEYNKKMEADAREEEAVRAIKNALFEIPEAVTAVLDDKERHAYRFIKGTETVAPAVEVALDNKWGILHPDVVREICDLIQRECGFSMVTATYTATPGKMTFYLVLS